MLTDPIVEIRLAAAEQLGRLYIQFWKVHIKLDPLLKLKEKLNLNQQINIAKKDLKKRDCFILIAYINTETYMYDASLFAIFHA